MSRDALFGIACKTCRRRGRRCDRTLPTCLSCKKRGVLCEGYVTRWVGVAARGKLAGQIPLAVDGGDGNVKGPVGPRKRSLSRGRPAGSPLCPQASTLSTPDVDADRDIRAFDTLKDNCDVSLRPIYREVSLNELSLRHRRGLGYSINATPSCDELEGLVGYYARELSTVFYLGPGPADSPYTYHILPMAEHIPSVRYAVAASASCHLANRVGDERMSRQSLRLRLRAIESLRQRLRREHQASDLGSLASILLLAQLDLCSGGSADFDTHLKAATALMKSKGSDGTDRGYFEQRLTWLDIMGATTASRMPHLSSAVVKAVLDKCKTARGREWGFDVFQCPIDLFEYIADITMLYKLQSRPETPRQEVLDKAILFGTSVRNWKPESQYHTSGPRFHMIEAWRSGILLYLVRLFQLHEDTFDSPSLVSAICDHAKAVPAKTSWSYSLLWPLFQAGLSLPHDDYERKRWFRSELSTMFLAIGCCPTNHALAALEQIWRKGRGHHYNSITAGDQYCRLTLS